MRRVNLLAAALTALLSSVGLADPAGSQGPIEFRFAPRPGQVIRQQMVMKSVGTLGLAPGLPGVKFTQSTTQEITAKCRQVNPDSSAVVDVTLTHIATRMNTAGITIECDSRTFDPAKAKSLDVRLIGRFFSALIGSQVTFTFDAQGAPTKVTGMREVVAKTLGSIKQELGQGVSAARVNQTIEGIGAMFDDESMLEQMKAFYRFIPSQPSPVAVGQQWQQNWKMELPVLSSLCNAKGSYVLLGIETFHGRPCARIGIRESFALAPDLATPAKTTRQDSPGMNRLLDQLDYSLNASNGEGTAYWDYQTGVLVQLRQTQRVVIDMKFKSRGEAATTSPAGTSPAEVRDRQSFSQQFVTSFQVDLLEGEADQTTTQTATQTATQAAPQTATTGPADR